MPSVTLYQFPPIQGLPSMSPFCIKVQMALRLKEIAFDTVSVLFAKRYNPRGKLPFVKWDDRSLEDSTAIIQTIDQASDVGPPLFPKDPAVAADAHLLEDWADESLFWFGAYAKFYDPNGWRLFRPHLAGVMPGYLRPIGPGTVKRTYDKKLKAHGLTTRSGTLIAAEFEQHLRALETRIQANSYLTCNHITIADLAVVSMLMPLTVGMTPDFQRCIEAHEVVREYIERVLKQTHIAKQA